MGKPVRILDLALQMIALSGLTPHEDIEIAFTGLRPGEKLYEELAQGSESAAPTEHPKITRLTTPPLHHSFLAGYLKELAFSIDEEEMEPAELKQVMARMLPEYSPFTEGADVELLPEPGRASLPLLAGETEPLPFRLGLG